MDTKTENVCSPRSIISRRTTGRFVVVEDHHPEDGLGGSVACALAGEPVSFVHQAAHDISKWSRQARLAE